jgi:MFS family permease
MAVDPVFNGMLASAGMWGMFIGAAMWGPIIDKVGRKFGFAGTVLGARLSNSPIAAADCSRGWCLTSVPEWAAG